ncbi:type IV toxin-antitoxin system AbiEi family antitoxin domain-containing protein [Nocardioides KLBMP 9356]|uniref:Type IV toxin-antitoxin system AbiEi family antitoxin domain-containing protein n=1 Tax=Nocardioides potassii TaxID=2911371 RepID=A0ABS9HBC2_9ACTN|nr:type IV toxin-antitoxin system AbiEi family antitoxin domain-containing protein [Nocardioides potassii]MCF6377421.1 type IV toxin-antitoxin system AbiEi family antitoxin domain-containing protein [Nocardioides potassii]
MYLPVVAQLQAQHGLITARQLTVAGVDQNGIHRLVSAGRLVRLRRGVYVEAETWADLDPYRQQPILRMRAAGMSLRSASYAFSHDSSGIVLGMGAPDPRTALVHVSRTKVHGDRQRAGVKHHLAPYLPGDVVEMDGLRVLDRPRTALDLAREHGRAHGLAACDAAMREGVTRSELFDALARMKDWPHSRCMRWCIEHADPLAESYLESLVRDFVLELGIGRPELQFGLTDGLTTAYADMAVKRHLFEADGGLKYQPDNPAAILPTAVLRKEKNRQDFLTGFKLGMSRLTYADLFASRHAALARVAREYADTCARFGADTDDLTPFRISRRR